MPQSLTMTIRVADPGWADDSVAEATARLREELLQLDVDSAEPAAGGPAPEGSKGVDAGTVGTLLVSLAAAKPLLDSVVATVQAWAGVAGARSVVMEVDGERFEATGASAADQRRLVQAWLDRHRQP